MEMTVDYNVSRNEYWVAANDSDAQIYKDILEKQILYWINKDKEV